MSISSYNGFSGEYRLKIGRFQEAEFAAGRAKRPTKCLACGQTEGRIIAHLEDYDDPIQGIMGLCNRCHLMVHCRFRAPEMWDGYRAAIRAGIRYRPAYSWDEFRVSLKRGAQVAFDFHREQKVDRTILDEIEEGRFLPSRQKLL